MRLTNFSDLAFRVLLYADNKGEEQFTIDEMQGFYDVSRGHLMKVVNALTREGYLLSIRGRSGGLRMNKQPSEINLGEVLRKTENDFGLVECMRADNKCVLYPGCKLPGPLNEAMSAFIDVLFKYTLEDMKIHKSVFELPKTAGND